VKRRAVAFAFFGALLASSAASADPENVNGRFRALTLSPKEHRELKLAGLERVTASSGACLEEGMATEMDQTMVIDVTCAGVRTSIAWLKGGVRVHVLICAEDEARPASAVKLRQKAQGDLKAWKSVTACVRGAEVHLLGWAQNPAEKEKLAGVAKRLGLVDKVEILGEEERD
jgi:hypothetical protein